MKDEIHAGAADTILVCYQNKFGGGIPGLSTTYSQAVYKNMAYFPMERIMSMSPPPRAVIFMIQPCEEVGEYLCNKQQALGDILAFDYCPERESIAWMEQGRVRHSSVTLSPAGWDAFLLC